MKFEEYRQHDAISLAELIAKGEVSAKEELESAIARAEPVNPAISAIVHSSTSRRARRSQQGFLPASDGRALSYQGPGLLRDG
jgi:amidase